MLDGRRLRDREHAGAADEKGKRHLPGSGAAYLRDLHEQPPARAPCAREAARAEGAVGDDGHPVALAPREDRVLDRPLLEVVEDLVARDAIGPGERQGPLELARVEVADAVVADLSVAHEPLEARDRLLERVAARPVEEVEVEAVGAE